MGYNEENVTPSDTVTYLLNIYAPFFLTIKTLTSVGTVICSHDLNHAWQPGSLFHSLSQMEGAGAAGVVPLTTVHPPQ